MDVMRRTRCAPRVPSLTLLILVRLNSLHAAAERQAPSYWRTCCSTRERRRPPAVLTLLRYGHRHVPSETLARAAAVVRDRRPPRLSLHRSRTDHRQSELG